MTKVIIIGAGIAGIKAAVDLHAKGIQTVILEARDRVGGRIYTYESEVTKRKYDIGASWFHEAGFNPLFEKYCDSKEVSYVFDDTSASIIGPEGEIPGSYKLGQVVDEMKLYAIKEKDQGLNLHTLSNRYIESHKKVLTEEQVKYAPQLLRMSEIMAGSWDMSNGSKAPGGYGGRDAFVTSHYDSLVLQELKDYPKENIKLSSVVRKISKKSDKGVSVETVDGGKYDADYCIVTVPQSVITLDPDSKGAIEFQPSLPTAITGNFAKLATVTLAKVVFEFESSFWPQETEKFIFIGKPEQGPAKFDAVDVKEFNKLESGFVPSEWGFPFLCVNLQAVKGIPSLLCLVPTPNSIYLEKADETEIWQLFKPMLSKLSAEEIPKPVNLFTTNWNDDSFSRGSVSAVKPNGLLVNDGFIEGWDSIRFAGEHTIYEGHGCVHGAWLSGKREADYIIERI